MNNVGQTASGEIITAQNPEVQKYQKQGLNEDVSIGNVIMDKNRQKPVDVDVSNTSTQQFDPETGAAINRPILDNVVSSTTDDYYSSLKRDPVDEATIYQEERDRIQAQVDAINELYASQLKDVQQQGRGLVAQTSAITTGAGLGASPFQQTAEAKTEKYNEQQERLVKAEQAQMVAAILGKADDRAMERIQAEKADVKANQKDYLDYLAGLQDDARQDMATMAQTGVDLSQLSETEYQKLLKDTGYSKLQFDSYFNALKPKAAQVKYEYKELKDGTLLRTGDDGSIEEIKEALPVENGYKLTQLSDGTLVQMNETTGDIKFIGEKGEFEKKTDTVNDDDIISIDVAVKYGLPIGTRLSDIQGMILSNKDEIEKEAKSDSEKEALASKAVKNIDLLSNALKNTKGLYGTVGVYGNPDSWFEIDASDKATFLSAMDTFISSDTLQQLLDLKKAGATLGAVSEKELAILQSSASELSSTAIRDENNKLTGFKIAEKDFIAKAKELGRKYEDTVAKLYNFDGAQDIKTQYEKLGLSESFADFQKRNNGNVYDMAKAVSNAKALKEQQSFSADLSKSVNGSDLKNVFTIAGSSKYRNSGWECAEAANKITDGVKLPSNYSEKLAKVVKKDNPVNGNTLVIPYGPKEYGHAGVVLTSSPDKKTFDTVEWNRNGDGKMGFYTYNIDELNAKYGDNWGFTDSKLKEDYKKNLVSVLSQNNFS
jgi:hypothetical protein